MAMQIPRKGAAHVIVFDQQSRAVGFLVILPDSKSTVAAMFDVFCSLGGSWLPLG